MSGRDFSDATFYKWRGRLGGMDVAEARRLRELEGENGKLKKLLALLKSTADFSLDVKNHQAGCPVWPLGPCLYG